MRKRTRATMGTAVISAGIVLTAWKGQFNYLAITAAALAFGVPEVLEAVKLYLKRDKCDLPPE